mmetsp:Transcript_19925/g.30156  ORF Transcript_19925/g.30156 Transcript_19925/m.30156 type:complete len:278 (+) Transcript_19925:91-924(+)|eukprot:CAMPEP_0194100024 /NCGR_PEP_ID=MMETSP0150-20130528/1050_1 /TAXON_ID=122233 /ORGANISM="Chaetoceros debilis, Strain MM31A-1" /LENGTH=277 /DNA_ID=CAMNT_0038786339 /DNA_START=70 /DNA_END=900 /DNA_ORIENTATION=+
MSFSAPDGIFDCIVIILCVLIGYFLVNSRKPVPDQPEVDDDEDDILPPRNFTQKQLLHFDGKEDENTQETKSIYLSLNGVVFDVSDGKDFYGPEGPYELFAGHECGVALAKMSFDKEFLDDMEGCKNMNFGEKCELDNWLMRFEHERRYPIRGRLIPDDKMPDPTRIISKEVLAENGGSGKVPEGYAVAPIYVGADDKVFDMSFGGNLFYGPDCSYEVFAGEDATRALALMSLKAEDAKNPDISDLDEKKIKILQDWIKTFEVKKNYPIVGKLDKRK